MDQFRLILILVGVALVLLVYYVSRRSLKPTLTESSLTEQKKPTRATIPLSGDVTPTERPYQAALENNKPKRQPRKRYVKFLAGTNSRHVHHQDQPAGAASLGPLTVTVYVMPLAGLQFRREQVLHCMQSLGCVPRTDAHYDYLILDDHSGKKVNRLFTISDVHEQGIFSHDPDGATSTNGLVLEMELPGPMESIMAFEKLLDVARTVATKLNGVVCDDLQNRLTKQATTHIKDKITDYNRKLRSGHIPSIQ